ncbi:unnamed protein product [Trifolium pratense]|uniref:Uncharacterized protein n=1 Tax=Trifolium pratense TaxID=57577 RepID=A0ACB0KTC6_TRIPR|nr:unnamed protein product [Trifolium pratense]
MIRIQGCKLNARQLLRLISISIRAFIHCSGGLRARCSFMQLVWMFCISVVWYERNNRIFKAKETTLRQMLDKVKLQSFWRLKTHNVNLGLNTHMW